MTATIICFQISVISGVTSPSLFPNAHFRFLISYLILHLKPPKSEHIIVAVITLALFFCTDNFDTNLLLILCGLMKCKMSL